MGLIDKAKKKKIFIQCTRRKEIGVLLLLTVLVFVICVFRLNRSFLPYLSTDEVGPMSVAAYFSGKDWSQMTQFISYYSYGYSLILWPLMKLFNQPVLFYRAAVVVNCLLASCVVPLSYYFSKYLNNNKSSIPQFIFAVLVALYPANILRANLALYEIPLIFVSWCLVVLFLRLRRSTCVALFCLTGFLLVYIYLIHQRALGILLAGTLVLCLMLLSKQIRLKQFLAAILPIILILSAHAFTIKPYIKEVVWQNGIRSNNNDYGSVIPKVLGLFTKEKIPVLIRGFSGQIFYLGTASFLLIYLAVYCLFVVSLNSIKSFWLSRRKFLHDTANFEEAYWGHIYLFSAFFANFFISVLFMGASSARADHLVYGRYNEIMTGPLLMVALMWICNSKKAVIKPLMYSFGFYSFFGLMLSISQGYTVLTEKSFAIVSSPLLYPFFVNGKIVIAAIFPIVFLCAGIVFSFPKLKHSAVISVLMTVGVCIYFVFIGYRILSTNVFSNGEYYYDYVNLVNQVSVDSEKTPLFYYISDYENKEVTAKNVMVPVLSYQPQLLQYLLWDRPLVPLSKDEVLGVNNATHLFAYSRLPFEIGEKYDIIDETNGMYLLFPRNSDTIEDSSINLPLHMFLGTKNEMGFPSSNGELGIFMYGPYFLLEPGIYTWDVTMQIDRSRSLISDDEIGFLDVYCIESDTVCYMGILTESGFQPDGSFNVSITNQFDEQIPQIELRAFAYSGIYLQVTSVRISKQN